MSKRKLTRKQSWRIEKIQEERAKRAAKRDASAEEALKAGALGGKLSGAGGGGFLLLFVPPEKQKLVKQKLDRALHVPFCFESLGSQIILYEAKDKIIDGSC